MEFEYLLEPIDVRKDVIHELDTSDVRFSRKLERYFWELRGFVIGLLQNRTYALWERLVILGLFLRRLEQEQANGFQGLEQLISHYRVAIDDGSLRESLAGIPTQSSIQVKLVKELIDQRFRLKVTQKSYLECLTETLAGLQATQEATLEEIGRHYASAFTEYYAPFMAEREYMLENYLVNYVFKNLFPLGPRGPFGEYVMLVMHYALIKMHLIGMAAFHKGLSEELIIRLVYAFSRVIEHSDVYLSRIYELIERSGLATMAYMAILIKN